MEKRIYIQDNIECFIVDLEGNGNDELEEVITPSRTTAATETSKATRSITKQHLWTHKSTKLLIDLYAERKRKFQDKSIQKTTLWKEIKACLENAGYKGLTVKEVDGKWRKLKRTYCALKRKNGKYAKGRSCVKWEHFKALEKLCADEPTESFGDSSTVATPTGQKDMHNNKAYHNSTALSARTSETAAMPSHSVPPTAKEQNFDIRERLLSMEAENVTALHQIAEAIDENNKIQAERNVLLQDFVDKILLKRS